MIALLAAVVMAGPVDDLGWLSGYWLSCDGGKEVSETWSLQGGELANTTTTIENGRPSVETARIALQGEYLALLASPPGQATTVFLRNPSELVWLERDSPDSEHSVLFENPEHDFPQRILYERRGDVLTARIEGQVDDELRWVAWRYRAAPADSHCPA